MILENVGNLVCPAEFDTGAAKNAMILSVPEGDDKPLKYPLMFSVCHALLVNKIDTLPVFDFDLAAVELYVYLFKTAQSAAGDVPRYRPAPAREWRPGSAGWTGRSAPGKSNKEEEPWLCAKTS